MSGQLPLFDGGEPELLSIRDYGEFKRALAASGCARCALGEGRTNIVVDRGSPAARILAIGEGPGAEEDATGRAFVGRGGRLLDRIMAEGGIDTERDFLIANVVKCRPPENRVPRADEAAACRPFLLHQIDLVSPRVIVLLGASAIRYLLPARKRVAMKEIVGRPFEDDAWPGITFLVLFHPAYLLRDPRKLPLAAEHVKTLRKIAGL